MNKNKLFFIVGVLTLLAAGLMSVYSVFDAFHKAQSTKQEILVSRQANVEGRKQVLNAISEVKAVCSK